MKKTLLLFVVLAAIAPLNAELTRDQLRTQAGLFMQFMKDFGTTSLEAMDREKQDSMVAELLAEGCTKIVNSNTIFTGRDGFIPQLITAKETFPFWAMYVLSTFVDEAQQAVTIYCEISSKSPEPTGTALIDFKALRFDAAGKISRITEVFSARGTALH